VAVRLDYEASCRHLHEMGFPDSDPAPPIPRCKLRYDDDEQLGITFFRTRVTDDLSGLTLPRTFFGRSEIKEASFRGTDLRESWLCWNDFIDVDFSEASSPDEAKRNPGRIRRRSAEFRRARRLIPDCASLHPGYCR
jgi:BTB/POZ domain-containing protein KCTD9